MTERESFPNVPVQGEAQRLLEKITPGPRQLVERHGDAPGDLDVEYFVAYGNGSDDSTLPPYWDAVFDVAAPRLVRDLLAALASVTAERDKWLVAFNRSEQFQSGPMKRAEAAEAEVVALRQQLEEAQRGRWQPIETAPKDGRPFLGWAAKNHGYPSSARWCDGAYRSFHEELSMSLRGYWSGYRPTHWMPLSDPPGGRRGEGREDRS